MAAPKDKGQFIEYNGKGLEFRNGSRSRLSTPIEVFEHFAQSAAIPPSLVLAFETSVSAVATYGTGLGGLAVVTTDPTAAKSGSLNGQGLNWQVDRQSEGQPLVFECRVKVGTLATREFWFGISDALADTAIIALSLTSTFTTSVPTDGVYIGYSDTPTSGAAYTAAGNQHTAISINNNTDAVVATGGGAFVTDTFYTYRIEVSSEGNAAYFVDGKLIGSKGQAMRTTVPVTLVMYAIPRATAGDSEAVMSIDYVYMGGM